MKIQNWTIGEIIQSFVALAAWTVTIAAVAEIFEPAIQAAAILVAVAISLAAIANGWRRGILVIIGIAMFLLSWPATERFGIWPGMLLWLVGTILLGAVWTETLRELSRSEARSIVSL